MITNRTECPVPSITCPKCGMTSFNPTDIAQGYCGHCHDWTTHVAEPELCACGRPLHYSSADMRALVEADIALVGYTVQVLTPEGEWHVPRHYIALHGIKAAELPMLAAQYGWPAA